MRHPLRDRWPLAAMLLIAATFSGCGWFSGNGGNAGPQAVVPGIPPDQMDAVLEAHFAGLGHMERYEYADAASRFREIRRLAPDWQPARINLAIALLNQTGEAIAESEAAPGAEDGGETVATKP